MLMKDIVSPLPSVLCIGLLSSSNYKQKSPHFIRCAGVIQRWRLFLHSQQHAKKARKYPSRSDFKVIICCQR